MERATVAKNSRSPTTLDLDSELSPLFRLDNEAAGELVLVRAAETEPDGRTLSASSEVRLSPRGIDQAYRLAQRFRSCWVEHVYSSPDGGACQTATIIAAELGRPLTTIAGLREVEYKGSSDRCCGEGQIAQRFFFQPGWDAIAGFEPTRVFRSRAIQAIEAVIALHSARRVLVVTHSSVINAYLSMLLDIPRDYFFQPDLASVAVVRWQDDRYAVRSLNDTSHLVASAPERGPFTGRSPALTVR